jgi:hypothetical protein
LASSSTNDNRNVADLNRAGDLADRLASLASTNETLVEQVGTIIEDATADAFALLTANWAAVVRVARVLQKHDYLVDCDLDDIIAHGRRGR